jgi:hypothetical protein
MIRARTLAAREAGRDEDSATLLEHGRAEGLDLAGYRCGASLIAGLETALPADEGSARSGRLSLAAARCGCAPNRARMLRSRMPWPP